MLELLEGLAPLDSAAVLNAARRLQITRGVVLARQGDPAVHVYALDQGRLRLTHVTVDGQEVIIRFVSPGEAFSIAGALKNIDYPVSVEAVDDSEVLAWDRTTFAQLMAQSPRLATNAMQALALRMHEMQDRIRELQTERVERRVARTVLRLVRQVGRQVPEGVLIDMALSRQDLAEMTGTTLYTVSRILSQWEQNGLIASGRERILIREPHSLVVIAEDLPQP